MKRSLLVLTALTAAILCACSSKPAETAAPAAPAAPAPAKQENVRIKIGASVTPHAEILAQAKDALLKEGIEIEIVEFTDYVLPNTALEEGDLDANYFQHTPYMDQFNIEKGTHLVSAGTVHYEPFGLFAGKKKSLSEVADGDQIAVPNDTTNEARALLLLEAQGLIKLKEGAGLTVTKQDITENPHKLDIYEMEAAQIARTTESVAFAVMNGNYAIQSGLKIGDALALEDAESLGARTYGNVIAVRDGRQNEAWVAVLQKVLHSEEMAKFIVDKYEGSVVPLE